MPIEQRVICNVKRHLGCHTGGQRSAAGIQWVEARDDVENPRSTGPSTKNCLVQNINSVEVRNLS